MSDYTRGLVAGTVGIFALWQIDQSTDLPWWAGLLIAFAVGFVSGVVALLLSLLVARIRLAKARRDLDRARNGK